MSVVRKQLVVNVNTPTGEFLTTWPAVEFRGFTKGLNGGLGECVLVLPRAFDYSGPDLMLGNDVEIRIADRDTTSNFLFPDSSRPIYRGYISFIERETSGSSETVTVHLLGYYTLLALDILKNGTQTTLYSNSGAGLTTTLASEDAADVGQMMRAVIDRYREETVNPKIGYVGEDIPDTGATATYVFEQKTYREAMDKLKEMAPAGIYYYIDENGMVKFKPQPALPSHKFIFGRHFSRVLVQHSLEKTRNFCLLWNGETGASKVYKHYQDDASIAAFGRRAYSTSDYGVDNQNAADLLGAKFIAETRDPEVKVTCVILDNNGNGDFGYDVESIQPGDTCSFYGFNPNLAEIFRDNMLITEVSYQLDQVEITVEAVKSGLVDWQEKTSKAVNDVASNGTPTIYT